ncbi:MAG TPA: hypothetical protein PK364_10330 [Synergistaceae bacterium]|nr:hypothetical protein [Synergistaceae bacterium]
MMLCKRVLPLAIVLSLLCIWSYAFFKSERGFPYFEIRYRGDGRDLQSFAMLGEKIFFPYFPECSRFFASLKALASPEKANFSPFSLRSVFSWNEKKGLWEEFFMCDKLAQSSLLSLRKDAVYQNTTFMEKNLFFSSSLSEREAKKIASSNLDFFAKESSSSFEWFLKDGGILQERSARFFGDSLFMKGSFSLV